MFYHRVLPPPLHPSVSTRRSSSIDSSNLPVSSSTDESSMTAVDNRSSSSTGHRSLRSFVYKDQEQIRRHNDIVVRNPELSSPILLRSSTRNLQKTPTLSTNKPDQETEDRLPSISREGDLTIQDSSPHVCLCQPDPKVPRPRNGMLNHCLTWPCLQCVSIHFVSPTPSSCCGCTKSWSGQSGYF